MELFECDWADMSAQNERHHVQVFLVNSYASSFYHCIVDGAQVYDLYKEGDNWYDNDRGNNPWSQQLGELIDSWNRINPLP